MMISENCSLLPYNTFGIQALARVLVTYDSADELRQALSLYRSQYAGLPLLHIGAGSNLLFTSYTEWHRIWLGATLPFGALVAKSALMLGYGITFFSGGYLLFLKKEF